MMPSVTVVSGLPRSGTSMMMKMLEAGGVDVLTDQVRQADADNPTGYYELERVKRLKEGDVEWVAEARGKAVKIISELLQYLPAEHTYRIVFMRRPIGEILASQRRMLENLGGPAGGASDERLAELFRLHLEQTIGWLGEQPNMAVLYTQYAHVVSAPGREAGRIRQFLDVRLDAQAAAAVVDPTLYRHRGVELGAERPA